MKARLGMTLIGLSALLLTMPASTLVASGGGNGGSGSGGGGLPVPQIAGTWRGQYTWVVAAFGGPANVTNQALMTLDEDPAGNVAGSFCYGAVPSPGCLPLKGKVQSNGAVRLEFASGGGATFKLDGAITGTMACIDGGTGSVIAGVFQVREGSGTFSFNNCSVQ